MAKIVLGIGIRVDIFPNVIWNLKRKLIFGILKQKNLKASMNFHPLIFLIDILALLGRGTTPHCMLQSSISDILVYISKQGRIGPCWEYFGFFNDTWNLLLNSA